jgi:hypothetical protein
MTHRSDPIPQSLQQHGGVPKRRAEDVEPLAAALDALKALDSPAPFTTSPAFEAKVPSAS